MSMPPAYAGACVTTMRTADRRKRTAHRSGI